jgi:hypothetical protein
VCIVVTCGGEWCQESIVVVCGNGGDGGSMGDRSESCKAGDGSGV